MRAFVRLLPALLGLMFLLPGVAFAKPVKIRIQVIEASKTSKAFDKRIAPLREAIAGYPGAKLVDELDTRAEPGATVTIEIRSRKQTLRVKVLEVKPDGTVRLKVAIDAYKFEANTTHKKGNATFVVAHKTGPQTALFLAVTPAL